MRNEEDNWWDYILLIPILWAIAATFTNYEKAGEIKTLKTINHSLEAVCQGNK